MGINFSLITHAYHLSIGPKFYNLAKSSIKWYIARTLSANDKFC